MEYINTKFGLHFSIRIKHPYFNDDACPYLLIEADGPTMDLLKSLRLITKVNPGEIKIIAPVIDTNENNKTTHIKQPLLEKHHYTFLLRVIDTSFYSISNLDLAGFPKEIHYFTNSAKSPKLSSKKCIAVNSNLLKITFDEGKAPVKIKIMTRDKAEVYSGDIAGSAEETPGVFSYDCSALKTGIYTIVYTFAKSDHKQSQTQLFYFNPTMRKQPVLGVIDIEALAFTNMENEDKNNYILQL